MRIGVGRRLAAGAMLIAVAAVGCSKPAEPVKVVSIDLSNAIDAHNNVISISETYAQESTVYASVATEGGGPAVLKATWTDPQGKVVTEQTQNVNPTKPARFEFHYLPPGGWAKGRYKVVFTIDGGGTRTREFEVR